MVPGRRDNGPFWMSDLRHLADDLDRAAPLRAAPLAGRSNRMSVTGLSSPKTAISRMAEVTRSKWYAAFRNRTVMLHI